MLRKINHTFAHMNKAYLLLGSNIGKRRNYLSRAVKLIEAQTKNKIQNTEISAKSSIYKTKAWGNKNQNDFLNQAICIETTLDAKELLEKILKIEKKLGRIRSKNQKSKIKKWQPRKIDIDILFFNNEIIDNENLSVPHPHLHKRRFALTPLNEIAEDFIHPVFKKTVKELINACPDKLDVKIHKQAPSKNKPFFICIEGNIGAGKTTLAKLLANKLNASLLLEKFEKNPHLKKFYKDQKNIQFVKNVEHWFANERVKQMSSFFKAPKNKIVVSDYHIEKCLVFSKINIGKSGMSSVSEIINSDIPKPDVILYLQRNIRELVNNIQKRGRNYEKSIQEIYLKRINREYLSFLSKWKKTTKTEVKIINSVGGREDLLKKALKSLKLTIQP